MSALKNFALLALACALTSSAGPHKRVGIERRTIDQIYAAALKEGGIVTLWHGGDEKNQQDALKTGFESRFPGMTLNLTVDLSKYHDGNIDQQLAAKSVYVDTVMLQTLQDFPRWKADGALLNYKPLGFEEIYKEFKDADGAYTGMSVFAWSNIWNTNWVNEVNAPKEFTDFLRPEFKDKLVLTYPNDDDAVLYQYYLIIKKYGMGWLDSLIAQNPRWVRGTATPVSVLVASNGTYTATFGSGIGLSPFPPVKFSFPTEGTFVSWPQTGAILKRAPHPESAKLLHSWMLSLDRQNALGTWSVRRDATPPAGFPSIMDMPGTDPTKFAPWMTDRAAVERLRFLIESKIGTAQGLSPLNYEL